jgi:hypothetical protein
VPDRAHIDVWFRSDELLLSHDLPPVSLFLCFLDSAGALFRSRTGAHDRD